MKIAVNALIREAAEELGMPMGQVKKIVEGTLKLAQGHLEQGNEVTLPVLGILEVRERQARTGVRPGTSERIDIPASKYPAFKPSLPLKRALNGEGANA